MRYMLKEGDVVSLDIKDEQPSENILPSPILLDILFENDDMIALNKPHGMPTHPSHGHFTDTLANGLMYYFSQKGEECLFRAVNRLDKDTSGVVLCAKNAVTAARLSENMQRGLYHKTYFAVVHGDISDGDIIQKNIKRKEESVIFRCVCDDSEGKYALTVYKKLALSADGKYSLVRLSPLTGRTHQLRVHMAHIGAPIVGDKLYGEDDGLPLMLHAGELSFPDPFDCSKITVSAPIPERFKMVYENF